MNKRFLDLLKILRDLLFVGVGIAFLGWVGWLNWDYFSHFWADAFPRIIHGISLNWKALIGCILGIPICFFALGGMMQWSNENNAASDKFPVEEEALTPQERRKRNSAFGCFYLISRLKWKEWKFIAKAMPMLILSSATIFLMIFLVWALGITLMGVVTGERVRW